MEDFKSLGLSDQVVKALDELGFEKPTPIQEQAVPQLVEGIKYFVGLAQTGTGKTAAFGLPLLELINTRKKKTQALVIAPTRELGQQIAEQLKLFAKYKTSINIEVVYGGANIVNQIRSIKKDTPKIIVATPGRLIDLIERKVISLSDISHVVLDEADEMLNMGFKEDLDKILSYTPDDKAVWLFSATMPKEIRRIISTYMDVDQMVEVKINADQKTNKNITHAYAMVRSSDKTAALRRIFDANPEMRGIVFCRTRAMTQDLAESLMKGGYKVDSLHGDMSQQQRDRVMNRFKAGHLSVIVATDVAARGIDVNDLTHVFHYNLPDQTEYYTHRSGRTARAGKTGESVTIATKRDMSRIKQIERELDMKMEKYSVPDYKSIISNVLTTWAEKLSVDDTSDVDSELYGKAEELLTNISREQLIKNLLASELKRYNIKNLKQDLNASEGRDDTRKRDGKYQSFFINIGRVDSMTSSELKNLIVETTRMKPDDIGDVRMEKSHSYIDLTKNAGQVFIGCFNDAFFEGRTLRVNADDSGGGSHGGRNNSGRRSGGFKSKGGGDNRRSSDRRSSGNRRR